MATAIASCGMGVRLSFRQYVRFVMDRDLTDEEIDTALFFEQKEYYDSQMECGVTDECLYNQMGRQYGVGYEVVSGGASDLVVKMIGSKHDSQLGQIHNFCQNLASKKYPRLLKETVGPDVVRVKEEGLGKFYHAMPGFLDEYCPYNSYSEYINAAYALAKHSDFGYLVDDSCGPNAWDWREWSDEPIERCLAYFKALHREFNSPEFKLKVLERKKGAARKAQRLNGLIDHWLGKRCKLCVARIDLEYKSDGSHLYAHPDVSEDYPEGGWREKVMDDFKRFLNGLRQCAFAKHMDAYAWRLEFGEKRGYHLHFIAIFNGSEVQRHVHYSHEMGKYWVKIAGKRGHYHNCNQEIDKYKRVGIGVIRRGDREMVGNLRLAASYLAKMDELLQVQVDPHCHLFGCSRYPEVKAGVQLPMEQDYQPDDTVLYERDLNLDAFTPDENDADPIVPFDVSERYTPGFIRKIAIKPPTPVRQGARRYLRQHELPVKGRKWPGNDGKGRI
jgi:hypothetical protein